MAKKRNRVASGNDDSVAPIVGLLLWWRFDDSMLRRLQAPIEETREQITDWLINPPLPWAFISLARRYNNREWVRGGTYR